MRRRNLNRVTLIGNLGCDPETRFTPGGSQVTTASLATNDRWMNRNGEPQRRTEWHRLVFWRRLAEIAGQYLVKGTRLYVDGRLQTRSWEDANGQRHHTTEIVVNNMRMLDAPGGPGELDMSYGGEEAEQLNFTDEMSAPAGRDDGLPF